MILVSAGRPGWREPLLPGGLAVAQVLLSAVSTGTAFASLTCRSVTPVWALGGTLVGIGTVGGAVVGPVAVLVALHALAMRHTAGLGAAGAFVAVLVLAGVVLPPVLRSGLLRGSLSRGRVWVMGRSRRRRQAGRAAVAAYRANSSSVPRLAAGAERARLAAELHDVAAHRLTGIARWHRELLKRCHTRTCRPKWPGHPPTVSSICTLILRLVRENPSWGYRRVHGELVTLGIKVRPPPCGRFSSRKALTRLFERASTTWADFARSQAEALLA
ncbi:hypothetical protein ABT120_61520 [Nonomuraea angiospora]|uniref:hypothetical protein n=1 Tax=Nonomuraea angiospora TaxID=46172 RepID=UPI00332DD519